MDPLTYLKPPSRTDAYWIAWSFALSAAIAALKFTALDPLFDAKAAFHATKSYGTYPIVILGFLSAAYAATLYAETLPKTQDE